MTAALVSWSSTKMPAARMAILPLLLCFKRRLFSGLRHEKQTLSRLRFKRTGAPYLHPEGGMKHIREFDGLRGLLALWVFATHALELGPYSSLARFTHANMAVDIFIILSGFVIFHLLSNGEDYRTFITRRWFRLFPVFAICFLIALTLYGWTRMDDEIAFGIGNTK